MSIRAFVDWETTVQRHAVASSEPRGFNPGEQGHP